MYNSFITNLESKRSIDVYLQQQFLAEVKFLSGKERIKKWNNIAMLGNDIDRIDAEIKTLKEQMEKQ